MPSTSKAKAGSISRSTRQKIEGILDKVIKDFSPTENEKKMIIFYSNMLTTRLKSVVPKSVEIAWVGSTARGTQLRGSSDIDIFLLFPRHMDKEQIKKKGLEYAKKTVKPGANESYVIKYAEHPYLKLFLKDIGITADIVPAFKISDAKERITAVDRTQLHNEFMSEKLSQVQKKQVIALKMFLKSHGIYGAGARYEGFSGYLCELLIYHYGSFIGVLENAASLKLPVLIDPLTRANGSLTQTKDSVARFKKEFIVIDPTDKNRNVAAVVSDESLGRLIAISKMMLEKPSLEFFYGPRYSDTYSARKISNIRKNLGIDLYLLAFKIPDITEEIIWQQTRRFGHQIGGILKKNGFPPIIELENVSEKEAIIAFFISETSHRHKIAEGPSIFMGSAAAKFLKSHQKSLGIFFSNNRIYALEDSQYKGAKQVVNKALESLESAPRYLEKKNVKIYVNDIPEGLAKLLYEAFVRRTSL